jgi:hypothetical protein
VQVLENGLVGAFPGPYSPVGIENAKHLACACQVFLGLLHVLRVLNHLHLPRIGLPLKFG